MSASKLFQPFNFNGIQLQHRVVLSTVPPHKANENGEPDKNSAIFYGVRARTPGTLLFTEGVYISAEAGGAAGTPGIFTPEQIAAWKKVTEAVHENGSYIYLQLLSEGRTADPEILKKTGHVVVSSGGRPIAGGANPKPLPLAWLERYKTAYIKAAQNALEAGFDGVEVHAYNGSLLDTFLQVQTNNRTDDYGGTVERRARFPLEVVGAIASVIGQEKVGVRISPFSEYQGMVSGKDIATYEYFVTQLSDRFPSLSHLTIQEPGVSGHEDVPTKAPKDATERIWNIWGDSRPGITTGRHNGETGKKAVHEHPNWLVSYSRSFAVNPDLPGRLYFNTPPLTKFDADKYFAGEFGYLSGYIWIDPKETFPHTYSTTPIKVAPAPAAAPPVAAEKKPAEKKAAAPAPAEKPAAKPAPTPKKSTSKSSSVDEKTKKSGGLKGLFKKILA